MCEMCCSGVKCSAVTSEALSPAGGDLGKGIKGRMERLSMTLLLISERIELLLCSWPH